jgi:hypothetical protein
MDAYDKLRYGLAKLTRAQRLAVWRVFKRDHPDHITPTSRLGGAVQCRCCGAWNDMQKIPSTEWRAFRRTVVVAFGGDCVMLPWKGMWLGIERDGYTHS